MLVEEMQSWFTDSLSMFMMSQVTTPARGAKRTHKLFGRDFSICIDRVLAMHRKFQRGSLDNLNKAVMCRELGLQTYE